MLNRPEAGGRPRCIVVVLSREPPLVCARVEEREEGVGVSFPSRTHAHARTHAQDRHLSLTARAPRILAQPGRRSSSPSTRKRQVTHTRGGGEGGAERSEGRRSHHNPGGREHVWDRSPGEEQRPPSDGKRPGLVPRRSSTRVCKSPPPVPAERGLNS